MNKQKNNFVFWMIALAGVGLLTLVMVKLALVPKENNSACPIELMPITISDHIKGNPDAAITLL